MKCKQTVCKELVPTSDSACVCNFTKLYDSIWGVMKKGPDEDTTNFIAYIEKIFVFALIWSVGATVTE